MKKLSDFQDDPNRMQFHEVRKEGDIVKIQYAGIFDNHQFNLLMADRYPFELFRIITRTSQLLVVKLLNQ